MQPSLKPRSAILTIKYQTCGVGFTGNRVLSTTFRLLPKFCRSGLWGAVAVALLCVSGGPSLASLLPEEPASSTAIDTIDPALQPINSTKALRASEQSVVRVLVVYRGYGGVPLDAVGMGSGFVVAPGYIVTNYHVIETPPEATSAEIYIVPHKDAGATYQQVTLAKSWLEGDLALLKADGLKIAPLKLSLVPQKNQRVVAMGYPGVTDRLLKRGGTELLEPADAYVTQGSIAMFASTNPDGSRVDTLFHTAPINPGNSGGPLMDECGQVVGVNTWSAVSTMSESGDVDVPAGQYVATHVAALNTFLHSAGTQVEVVVDPCYAKSEDEIVKDEGLSRALAAYQAAQLKRLEDAQKAESANAVMDQLQLGALVLLSVLVLVLIWLIIRRRHHPKEKDAPTAYSIPAEDAGAKPASPLHPKVIPAKKAAHRHGVPWGWLLLAVAVVLLALGFVFRESPVYQRLMAPKPQTTLTSAAEGSMRLTCEVDKKASPKPLSGAGPTEMEFDASRACVNGRIPYEAQNNGTLLRFTVSDSEPMAARLELSRDGMTFTRSDYRLDAEAHRLYAAQREALGTLRCAAADDAGQQKALKENLQKVRTLAQSYLAGVPETRTVWRCRKADEK